MGELRVGIDFGTTNSALAVGTAGDEPELVGPLRSALHFDAERREPSGRLVPLVGDAALDGHLESGGDGRLIQSTKSFLASPLFVSTNVFGTTYSLQSLIALILKELRRHAEERWGSIGERAVVGRPVRFAGGGARPDEGLAVRRLGQAFLEAGFRDVRFEFEPVAAAWHYERKLSEDALVLIGDFGGGTSDFCLVRVGPGQLSGRRRTGPAQLSGRRRTGPGQLSGRRRTGPAQLSGCRSSRPGQPSGGRRAESILANDGVGIAGDAFDGRIVRHVVSPRLGRGEEFRSVFGRLLPVPGFLYGHLERWNHVSFLRSPRTLRLLHDLRRDAVDPVPLEALLHLVENDLGFELYRAVQDAKETLSRGEETVFRFCDGPIEIERTVTRSEFESWIAPELEEISRCVDGMLARCAMPADEIEHVFLTGGSSLVPAVRRIFEERFGTERIDTGAEFTSVARGLALSTP